MLPPDVLAHHELCEAALRDYQALGYRVVASYPATSQQWPAFEGAQPDVIRIDGRELTNPAIANAALQAIHAIGALGLAAKLETGGQVEQARAAGFELLQGHAVAVPATEPVAGVTVVDSLLSAPAFW